jgi:glutathione S-transferase
LVLHAKGVRYRFHDVENDIYTPQHLGRHPFGRVPALLHRDFWVYETSAIALYVEEAFDGPRLMPQQILQRARVHQWISSLNAYFYPYMIYYLVHERIVFPDLGIAPDEDVIAEALPKVERALQILEAALQEGPFLVGEAVTLADYFLLPTITAVGLTAEGTKFLSDAPRVRDWLARIGARPEVVAFRAILPPRAPIEHARRWATEHRPGVRYPRQTGGSLGIGG